MSVMSAQPRVPTTPPECFPGLYRITVAQYDRMLQNGTIGKNDRVELIEGLLVTKIPVFWIVNLVERQIEVYTQPSTDGYQSRQDFAADQSVPVCIDGRELGRISVSDILP